MDKGRGVKGWLGYDIETFIKIITPIPPLPKSHAAVAVQTQYIDYRYETRMQSAFLAWIKKWRRGKNGGKWIRGGLIMRERKNLLRILRKKNINNQKPKT